MRAGKNRHRLRIETNNQVNEAGVSSDNWIEVAVVRGSVEDLSGRELMEDQAVVARASVRVRIRYRSGLSSKHRLVVIHTDDNGATIEDRTLNIESVLDLDGRRRELEVMCTEAK